jgi:hypothetical protein
VEEPNSNMLDLFLEGKYENSNDSNSNDSNFCNRHSTGARSNLRYVVVIM